MALARKAGHAYTKEKVDEFVKRQAAAQILTARKAPNRVTGKFQATRQGEKFQIDLLDRSTKPSQLDGVAQTHVLAVVDVFTRRGYLEPLVDKTKATVLAAYQRITERAGANLRITERAGANPQILSLDKEGATLSNDGAFEAFLDEKGTVVRRAEGRNDLAIIDGYMGRLGLELGRIRLKKKLRMNQWAPEIAGVEASLNRKPMSTLRGNAPRDLEQAIASTDPGEKIPEFQQLEQQARNIAVNRAEDKKVTRTLEREGAFRAPIEARGVIRTRNRPGKARFEGKVRPLENGKVEFGRAVDANTGQSFPAKLVNPVPTASETVPEEALQDGRPQWRVEQNREIFAPFLEAALDFVGEETKSASELKKFLVALPKLNFNEAARRAFGAAKAPVKEFLASFAERFEYNKRLTQVRLKRVTRRRLRGKQAAIPTRSEPSAPSAQPARRVPIPFRRTRAATRRK